MYIQFNPEVKWLLINKSTMRVELRYINCIWKVPVIGIRPPFYANPRYGLNYPVI